MQAHRRNGPGLLCSWNNVSGLGQTYLGSQKSHCMVLQMGTEQGKEQTRSLVSFHSPSQTPPKTLVCKLSEHAWCSLTLIACKHLSSKGQNLDHLSSTCTTTMPRTSPRFRYVSVQRRKIHCPLTSLLERNLGALKLKEELSSLRGWVSEQRVTHQRCDKSSKPR